MPTMSQAVLFPIAQIVVKLAELSLTSSTLLVGTERRYRIVQLARNFVANVNPYW